MGAAVGAIRETAAEAAGDALYGEERAEGESQHGSAEPFGAGCSAGPPSPRQALRAAARRRADLHLDTGWETPELPPEPSRALVRENRLRGTDLGPLTASARWKRERDVPDEVWFRADEAGLEAASRTGTAAEPGPP